MRKRPPPLMLARSRKCTPGFISWDSSCMEPAAMRRHDRGPRGDWIRLLRMSARRRKRRIRSADSTALRSSFLIRLSDDHRSSQPNGISSQDLPSAHYIRSFGRREQFCLKKMLEMSSKLSCEDGIHHRRRQNRNPDGRGTFITDTGRAQEVQNLSFSSLRRSNNS